MTQTQTETPIPSCPRCEKPPRLCVCDALQPVEARTRVLILQHPQEPDRELGSARIAHLSLPGSVLRIGLSWPNLRAALGEEASSSSGAAQGGRSGAAATSNQDWMVLYLGSARPEGPAPRLVPVDRKGAAVDARTAGLGRRRGVVVLDGTWSQAKTLWWRNAWLLKLQRVVLQPAAPSLYATLRKEPRREGLSTIEAIAQTLVLLEGRPELMEALLAPFRKLLQLARHR